jgi:hypothetical protein
VPLPHHRTRGSTSGGSSQRRSPRFRREIPRKTEAVVRKITILEGLVHHPVLSHRPGSTATVTVAQCSSPHAKTLQRIAAAARVVPSLPGTFAHVAPAPSTEVLHFPPPIGQSEVVPPPIDESSPLRSQHQAGPFSLRFPKLTDFLLQSLERARREPTSPNTEKPDFPQALPRAHHPTFQQAINLNSSF